MFLHLQPILKGLPGDADHVADADRLKQSGVGEFIGRSAADTENGCDVIHGVCSALGRSFFVGCVGAHKNHHADRSALGTNRDEREQTNGRLSCRIKFEEEAHYNAR